MARLNPYYVHLKHGLILTMHFPLDKAIYASVRKIFKQGQLMFNYFSN